MISPHNPSDNAENTFFRTANYLNLQHLIAIFPRIGLERKKPTSLVAKAEVGTICANKLDILTCIIHKALDRSFL